MGASLNFAKYLHIEKNIHDICFQPSTVEKIDLDHEGKGKAYLSNGDEVFFGLTERSKFTIGSTKCRTFIYETPYGPETSVNRSKESRGTS